MSITARAVALSSVVAILGAAEALAQSATVVSSDANQPVVHAGLFHIRADGTVGGFAAETAQTVGEDLSATVYMAPCSTLGATSVSGPVSASATEAWQLSGRVVALSDTQASIQLTWKRVRRGGQDVTTAPQSVAMTLNRGERTTLDSVALPAAGVCEEHSAALSLLFASREDMHPGRPVLINGVPAGGGGGRAGAGFGGGGTAARAGSGGAGDGAPRGTSGVGGGGGFGGGGGGRTGTYAGSGGGGGGGGGAGVASFGSRGPAAEFWLVHSPPAGAESTLYTRVTQVWSLPRPFTFEPLTIRTPSGVLTVVVQGTVETGLTPQGEPRLYFSATRSVTFAPAGRAARDTAPVTEGSTKTVVRLRATPGSLALPTEVLSFEMPPLRIPGGATLPDRLSIRLRLSPAAAAQTAAPE